MNLFSQKIKLLFILMATLLVFTATRCENGDQDPKEDVYVIMLSMDGFRWDYAERVPTPNLDYIAENGVIAEYLLPGFPTKTFPNHYTMATGLYPDNHGIVNNNFYCEELDMTYRLGDRDAVENEAFYGGEPIWVTAEKQNMTAASYFWVGSEAPVKGIQPTYWKRYDHNFPYENRIDTVIYWLELPIEKRPRLITFYFNEPDSQGHRTGPDSPEVNEKVKYVDSLVGDLMEKISRLPIADQINLIVTSDHGMAKISTEKYVDLTDYVQRDWFEKIHGGNPMFTLRPKQGMKDSVYNLLKGVNHIYTWKTDEIPERLNYGKNPRTLDMIVLADSTWSIGWGEPSERFYSGGTHGWDNAKKDMHTIFYAIGPAFKETHVHPPFEVVDLYPLITHLLNLDPAETDGKLERTIDMLK